MHNRNLLSVVLLVVVLAAVSVAANKPNVVIMITDDQGYGDLGFTGNPAIKIPTLDKLRTQSTLLNNFHVDPTCAPTRSALMTGRYSDRVGVWHTVQGRSMLRRRETTMADIFADNGYATGIFGKWHLGDCYGYFMTRVQVRNAVLQHPPHSPFFDQRWINLGIALAWHV